MIKLKRIYEQPEENDGFRILVDRLWPRGISKEQAAIDLWFKEIAPSDALRKWFGHDPKKWLVFQKRYQREILANQNPINQLKEIIQKRKRVTLLYGAKNDQHNQAVVIEKMLS